MIIIIIGGVSGDVVGGDVAVVGDTGADEVAGVGYEVRAELRGA